VARITATEP